MKRVFALLLTLAWLPLWGQVALPDSTQRTVPADSVAVDEDDADDGPNVIGAQPAPRRPKGEANIIGSPVYYNTDGTVRGSSQPARMPSHRSRPAMPERHYLNNVGLNFSSFFLEVEAALGQRSALGLNFTYLPERWGIYGSALFGPWREYFSVGPAVRLSGLQSSVDWHLYSGLTFGHRVGGEIGFRVAAPSHSSEFCWSSASLGMAVIDGRSYLTLGLSLELSAILGLSLFLW